MIRNDLRHNTLSSISFYFSSICVLLGSTMAIRFVQVYISSFQSGVSFDTIEAIIYLLMGITLIFQFLTVVLNYGDSEICTYIMSGTFLLSIGLRVIYEIIYFDSVICLSVSVLMLILSIIATVLIIKKSYRMVVYVLPLIYLLYCAHIIISNKSFVYGYVNGTISSSSPIAYIIASVILTLLSSISIELFYIYMKKKKDNKTSGSV